MVEMTITRHTDGSADFELPEGCLLCSGPLAVRVTPGGSGSCCVPCRWLARPSVELSGDSVQVSYPTTGEA
jgi:hypothetical protein